MTSIEDILGKQGNKNFSYAEVRWEIENFSLISSTPQVISSPPIALIGPVETSWKLNLHIPRKTKNRLFLKVEMKSFEFQKSRAYLHWAFCLLDETERGSFSNERTYSFEPNTSLVLEYFTLDETLKIANKKEYDTLILKCRMLVEFGVKIEFPKFKVAEAEHLSNALSKLPTSFLHHDTVTTVNEFKFSLHKAMLFFRGTKLVRFIEQSTSKDSSKCSLLRIKAAMAVFQYLYSGNLKFILDDPCLTITEFTEHLEIPENEDVYDPQRVTVSSKIELKEKTITWKVPNFKSISRTVMGPKFEIEDVKSSLQLSLYVKESKGDPPKKSLSVEVQLLNCEMVLVVCFDFEFFKDETQLLCTRRIHGVMGVNDRFGVTILENDSPKMCQLFLTETLLIKVRVYRRVGKVFSFIIENKNPALIKIPHKEAFVSLSKTLAELRKTGVYSDLNFQVGDQLIKAHKFLVAARSPVMKELLKIDNELKSVEVHECTKEVVETFLYYMYLGILTENDGDKLIELYNLGKDYGVQGLKNILPQVLSKCINETNMLRILIFADGINNDELKESAFSYVLSKSSTLENHEDHDMLKNKKPDIYRQIQNISSIK